MYARTFEPVLALGEGKSKATRIGAVKIGKNLIRYTWFAAGLIEDRSKFSNVKQVHTDAVYVDR